MEAVANHEELAMLSAVTVEMAEGFSLYMVKAVVNGQTDEINGLVKTKLRR